MASSQQTGVRLSSGKFFHTVVCEKCKAPRHKVISPIEALGEVAWRQQVLELETRECYACFKVEALTHKKTK